MEQGHRTLAQLRQHPLDSTAERRTDRLQRLGWHTTGRRVQLRPALVEQHRQHRGIDRVGQRDGEAGLGVAVGAIPPVGVPDREVVDGCLGVDIVEVGGLVEHAVAGKVFHDDHEVGAVVGHRTVVTSRHTHRHVVGEFVEELRLTDVHAQHRAGEHGVRVDRCEFHDDGFGHVGASEVRSIDGAADADAGADLVDLHVGDVPAEVLVEPCRRDVRR